MTLHQRVEFCKDHGRQATFEGAGTSAAFSFSPQGLEEDFEPYETMSVAPSSITMPDERPWHEWTGIAEQAVLDCCKRCGPEVCDYERNCFHSFAKAFWAAPSKRCQSTVASVLRQWRIPPRTGGSSTDAPRSTRRRRRACCRTGWTKANPSWRTQANPPWRTAFKRRPPSSCNCPAILQTTAEGNARRLATSPSEVAQRLSGWAK